MLVKNKFVDWTFECDQVFKQLKDLCSKSPILVYVDYPQPFKLDMDASGTGLGAAFYQIQQDGLDEMIAYTSRHLSQAERKYPIINSNFWHLNGLLLSNSMNIHGTFHVYTNNNPLTYILTSTTLDATKQRS